MSFPVTWHQFLWQFSSMIMWSQAIFEWSQTVMLVVALSTAHIGVANSCNVLYPGHFKVTKTTWKLHTTTYNII